MHTILAINPEIGAARAAICSSYRPRVRDSTRLTATSAESLEDACSVVYLKAFQNWLITFIEAFIAAEKYSAAIHIERAHRADSCQDSQMKESIRRTLTNNMQNPPHFGDDFFSIIYRNQYVKGNWNI